MQQFTSSTSFSHAYAAPGTYTVTITAKDQDGLTTKASMQITVHAPLGVTFTSNPATGIVPLPVQFSASGLLEGTLYSVDFGTATYSQLSHYTLETSHTYPYAGTYTAVLRSGINTIIGAVQTIVSTTTSTYAPASVVNYQPQTTSQDMSTVAPTPPQPVSVVINNFSFSPSQISIKAGTKVTWINNDSVAHTVTSKSGLFGSVTLNPGSSFNFVFNTVGNFDYYCTIHPSMTATVVVIQ
jgi:plastocyanin